MLISRFEVPILAALTLSMFIAAPQAGAAETQSNKPKPAVRYPVASCMRAANFHLAKKRYARAKDLLTKVIETDANNAAAYLQRGKALYGLNEYKAAIADFDKARELGTADKAEIALARGKALHYLGQHEGAVAEFCHSLGERPQSADTYLHRASAYDALGESDKAIEDITRAIEIDRKNADAYLQRALQFRHLKKYKEALLDYEEAVRLNPALVRWQSSFAEKEEHVPSAIAHLGEQVKLKTGSERATAHFNRGVVFSDLGRYKEAIKDFNSALLDDPKSVDAYHHRGIAYFKSCDFEKAVHDFTKALKLKPGSADIYAHRAAAHYHEGKTDLALEDFTQAIALAKDKSNFYVKRGLVYAQSGKHKEAIADFSQAIDLESSDSTYYLDRALEYASIEDHKHAIDDFSKAIALEESPLAYKNRAMSREKSGDDAGALEDLSKSAELYARAGNKFGSWQITRLISDIKSKSGRSLR